MSTFNFEKHLSKANAFMNILTDELGVYEKEKAYRIFKSVLHSLRDNISVQESLQFIAQLPFILKAVYVENWTLKNNKRKIKHMNDFIDRIKEKDSGTFYYDFTDTKEVERAAKIVFSVLADFVSEGEMNNIKSILPKELKLLFDNETVLI